MLLAWRKPKGPGSLRSHGLNGDGAALIFPVMVMPFFLWERLSAAKISPVMGEVMLSFAPGSCATRFFGLPFLPA